ncbi:hypothetical protein RN001_012238 [Aquatica leii]|uniref:Uncharacterized protein n=1 Tax=Aquatica leii TaxID=1421715 RepID=A0AAN7P5W3_9COLE|nr:hypothetical protein RN001_012238 [Aquatica leii]
MRRNPGVRISEYEIAGLVNTAFTKVSRVAIAQKGFECTGIVPRNPHCVLYQMPQKRDWNLKKEDRRKTRY